MREVRWITEAQAKQLFAHLEAEQGGPTLEDVRVGEDGSTIEVERWGDETTTTRRTPLKEDDA